MTRRYTCFEKKRLCITLLETWRSKGFPSATAAFNGQPDPSSPTYYIDVSWGKQIHWPGALRW